MGFETIRNEGYIILDIDESGSSYYYYGFINNDGGWLILRTNTGGTEYRYSIGNTFYDTAWTNRASQSYGILYS